MAARTPAIALLARHRIAHTLHTYVSDPGTDGYGAQAATALEVPARRLFKTLVASVDGRLVCAVVPVAGQLDLKALARASSGKKAVMADPVLAQRSTGYVLGAISPLGQRTPLPTVLDASASAFATVFVSAGRRGLQVELAPADLVTLTSAAVAAIGT